METSESNKDNNVLLLKKKKWWIDTTIRHNWELYRQKNKSVKTLFKTAHEKI